MLTFGRFVLESPSCPCMHMCLCVSRLLGGNDKRFAVPGKSHNLGESHTTQTERQFHQRPDRPGGPREMDPGAVAIPD